MTALYAVEYRDVNTGHTRHSTPTPHRTKANQLAAADSRHATTEGETVEVVEWDGEAWPRSEARK